MKKKPIASIINFCSNESRFIQACLEQAHSFSQQVIVPVCDHFFDGTPENRRLLEQIYAAFPSCLFIEYPFVPKKIPSHIWKTVDAAHFWHSLSRLVGFAFLNEEIESVLFLDADEVPDGKRFAEWLECSDYELHTTLKLSNYWYFRDPCNQALRCEDSIVLVQKRALKADLILNQEEREAMYNLLPGPKRRNVTGVDGAPMFHHYSWVRTKEEMLKKVQSWGHKGDRNWADLVHQEFAAPFKGTDFVHGYAYKIVEPPFDIRWNEPLFLKKGEAQVIRMDSRNLIKLIRQIKNPIWKWVSDTFLGENPSQ